MYKAAMATVGALLLLLSLPCKAVAGDVRLNIEIFSCFADAATAPKLRISDIGKQFADVEINPAWTADGSVWATVVTIPEGHYIVHSGSKHCSGESEQWIAIPGDTRHLVITLNETKVFTIDEDMYAGAVYGLLPTPTARIEIMSADSVIGEQTRKSAQVDGNSYQFSHLRQGQYVLRVAFGNVVASRNVTIAADSYGNAVRADLTRKDAIRIVQTQAAGSGFVPVPNTKKEPAETFRLGKATIDGWVTDPLARPSDYSNSALRISVTATAALLEAQSFLNSDRRIPNPFKKLSAWSARIMHSGHEGYVIVQLQPADLASWLRVASKAPESCFVFLGSHYVNLAINVRTGKVDEARICP